MTAMRGLPPATGGGGMCSYDNGPLLGAGHLTCSRMPISSTSNGRIGHNWWGRGGWARNKGTDAAWQWAMAGNGQQATATDAPSTTRPKDGGGRRGGDGEGRTEDCRHHCDACCCHCHKKEKEGKTRARGQATMRHHHCHCCQRQRIDPSYQG